MAKTYRELKDFLVTLTDEQLDQTIIVSTPESQQGGTELSIEVTTTAIFYDEDNEWIPEEEISAEEANNYREDEQVLCEVGRVVTYLE